MRRSFLAIVATAALALGTLVVHAQQRDSAPVSGVNVAGGMAEIVLKPAR